MPRLLVIGEDLLCCALGERIVERCLPGWTLASPPINTGGITKLRVALPRYAMQARHVQPVFCLADTDGECVVDWLQAWCPFPIPASLVLRLAVHEAESWVLADRTEFSRRMGVPAGKIPQQVDALNDPKSTVLKLIGRSRSRLLRTEMVSASDPMKRGAGYNLHLCRFVRHHWDPETAREGSPSLDRAIRRLQTLMAASS